MSTAARKPSSVVVFLIFSVVMISLAASVSAQQPWPVVETFEQQYKSEAYIYEIGWNTSGEVLAVTTESGLLMLDRSLNFVAEIYEENDVSSVSWHPMQNRLAIIVDSHIEIWHWDVNTQTLAFERNLETDRTPYVVKWSPNGQYIASLDLEQDQTYYDWIGVFNIWDVSTWTLKQVIGEEAQRYLFYPSLLSYDRSGTQMRQIMAWHPGGDPIIASVGHLLPLTNPPVIGAPMSVYFLDIETGQESRIFPLVTNNFGYAIDWQPTQTLIAITGDYGIQMYDFITGDFLGSFGSTTLPHAESIEWDPSGNYVTDGNSLSRVHPKQILGETSREQWIAKAIDWTSDGQVFTVADDANVIWNWNPLEFPGYTPEPPLPTLTPSIVSTPDPTDTPIASQPPVP